MKTRIIISVLTGLALASCNKTYVCKDQTGVTTCEVSASSHSKANSMCNQNISSPQTASIK